MTGEITDFEMNFFTSGHLEPIDVVIHSVIVSVSIIIIITPVGILVRLCVPVHPIPQINVPVVVSTVGDRVLRNIILKHRVLQLTV